MWGALEAIMVASAGLFPLHQHAFCDRTHHLRCSGNNYHPYPHGSSLAIGLICHRNTLLSPFQLVPTETSLFFPPASLLLLSSLYGYMGLFCLSWKTLHLSSLKTMRWPHPVSPLLQTERSPRLASLPSTILSVHQSFVLCINLQIMLSIL